MKILIADDHELFLKGLALVLSDYRQNMEIITAKSYTEVFNVISQQKNFDLVLTDLAMPGAYWLEALKKIHVELPETPVIILSAVFEKEIIKKSINIGAAGYISKTAPNQEILQAIDLVLAGGVYIPQDLLDKEPDANLDLLEQEEHDLNAQAEFSETTSALSPRQRDVLQLIAKGMSNKQIAFELGITEGTVKLYVTAILKLLGVYNRTAALIKAKEWGIIKDASNK